MPKKTCVHRPAKQLFVPDPTDTCNDDCDNDDEERSNEVKAFVNGNRLLDAGSYTERDVYVYQLVGKATMSETPASVKMHAKKKRKK